MEPAHIRQTSRSFLSVFSGVLESSCLWFKRWLLIFPQIFLLIRQILRGFLRAGGGQKRKKVQVEPWFPSAPPQKYQSPFKWDDNTWSGHKKGANRTLQQRAKVKIKWTPKHYMHDDSSIPNPSLYFLIFQQILEPGCSLLLPFRHVSISEVQHWCWETRPGSQSTIQLMPKLLDMVFLHNTLRKPFQPFQHFQLRDWLLKVFFFNKKCPINLVPAYSLWIFVSFLRPLQPNIIGPLVGKKLDIWRRRFGFRETAMDTYHYFLDARWLIGWWIIFHQSNLYF